MRERVTVMTPRNHRTPPPDADGALEALLERSIQDAGGKVPAPPAAAPAPPVVERGAPEVRPEIVSECVRYSEGSHSELYAALADAQAEMSHASRESTNPYYNSRYADLSQVMDAARGPLNKHGIAILQMPFTRAGRAVVVTRFGHKSGQWIESELELTPMQKQKDGPWVRVESPHAMGSAISYARRYSLLAMSGIATDDDDANAANGFDEGEEQRAPARPVQRAAAPPMRQQRAAGGGGVDIGNTRMNTQEAANYVRDRKLDQLREQAAAPAAPPAAAPAPPAPVMQSPVPMMGSKSGEIKRAFAGVRERLGEVRYNAELAAAGVGDPLRLRSLVEARALFKRLWNAAASEVA
jgi:hypothetical protein